MNLYYEPEKYGLKTIGEIDWSSGAYEFDLLVIWQRLVDGAFLVGEDSGCSCPLPFEDKGVDDLSELGSLAHFNEICFAKIRTYDRSMEMAALVEKLHVAGLR